MRFLFETIIFGFLLFDGIAIITFIVFFFRKGKKLLRPIPIGLFLFYLISFGVIFYGSFIEPRTISVTYQPIQLKTQNSMVEGAMLRVALLSDFHLGPYKKADFVSKVVQKVNDLQPDLILIAGDFVFETKTGLADFLAPLKDLQAPLGIYAVLGNHDYGDHYPSGNFDPSLANNITETLQNLGITVLRNEGKLLWNRNLQPLPLPYFLLLGVDDIWANRADVKKALTEFDSTGYPRFLLPSPYNSGRLLLSHNPDIVKEAEKEGIDLVLAGHTHGGQIRLPLIGPIPPLPTRLGRTYDQGLFQFGKTQLFISRGLGETGTRARLFAPPEIALLEISL